MLHVAAVFEKKRSFLSFRSNNLKAYLKALGIKSTSNTNMLITALFPTTSSLKKAVLSIFLVLNEYR